MGNLFTAMECEERSRMNVIKQCLLSVSNKTAEARVTSSILRGDTPVSLDLRTGRFLGRGGWLSVGFGGKGDVCKGG